MMMEKTTTILILSTTFLLSLLCFIPPPQQVDFNFNQALLSENASVSFLCAAVASFPMFLDCLWDFLCKLKWIQMESSRDLSYLIERMLIFVSFICPTVGYFFSRTFALSQVGKYYNTFSNLQTIWLSGAYIALLHSSKGSIWTLRWCLCIVVCIVGSKLSSIYASITSITTCPDRGTKMCPKVLMRLGHL